MSLYNNIFEQSKTLNDLLPSNLLSDLEIDTNETSSFEEESITDVFISYNISYNLYRTYNPLLNVLINQSITFWIINLEFLLKGIILQYQKLINITINYSRDSI